MKSKKFVWIAAAILLAGMVSACDGLGGGGEFVSPIPGIIPGGGGPVTFKGVRQIGGGSGYLTTALTLNFSGRIAGLAAGDITLAPLDEKNPDIQGETLTGTGPSYTLTVSGIESEGEVEVSVSKSGVTGGPHKVTVFYGKGQTTPVVFSGLAADGTGKTEILTLTFDGTIGDGGLALENIELNGGGTGATADSLDGEGDSYTLYVSGINVSGDVSVSVSKPGYDFAPGTRTATVLAAEAGSNTVTGSGDPVAFTGVSSNGTADKYPTTVLYLDFNAGMGELKADDITLEPVGELNKNIKMGTPGGGGPSYWLPVSGVAVEGFVKVSVSKSGYAISGNPKTAAVHAAGTVSPGDSGDNSGSSGDNSGSSGDGSGRSGDNSGNSGDNSGNSGDGSGSSGDGSGSSGDNSGNSCSGSGTYTPETVVFKDLTANGVEQTQKTTYLTLEFGSAIGDGGLDLADIHLNAGATGATASSLTNDGASYMLYVDGITAGGNVSVSVSKPGYAFDPPLRTVTVHRNGTPVTMTAAEIDGSNLPGASATTTGLSLIFSLDIGGLTKNEITLTPYGAGNSGILAGEVSGTGAAYILPVTGIDTSGQISVSVNKGGYSISSKMVYVYYAEEVEFTGVKANGEENTTPTTVLTLEFDKEIVGLTKYDIEISNSNAQNNSVQKGELSKVPSTTGTYKLPVSGINAAETLTVTMGGKSGYIISGSPQQVTVHIGSVRLTGVTANGGETLTTTQLTLNFDKNIAGLTADNITVTDGTGKATKNGTLSGSGKKYTLPVTVTQKGKVNVEVSNPAGYVISGPPQDVQVDYVTQVMLSSVTANGSSSTTTTDLLTLTFDKDIAGLGAGDITLSSGTKGNLNRTGMGVYTLGVSGITGSGSIIVNSVSKSGYSITGTPRDVAVYYVAPLTQVTLESVTANNPSSTTNQLTLTFNNSVVGLSANNIEITNNGGTVTGKSILSGSGSTWYLPVTVTGSGTIDVSVSSPAGYNITGSKSVTVNYAAPTQETAQANPMAGGGVRTLINAGGGGEGGTYYEVHTLTADGELVFLRKPAAGTVEVLVVGGGAGGFSGADGGAGGYVYHTAFALDSSYVVPVTVGVGGNPSTAGGTSQFGSDSGAYIRATGGSVGSAGSSGPMYNGANGSGAVVPSSGSVTISYAGSGTFGSHVAAISGSSVNPETYGYGGDGPYRGAAGLPGGSGVVIVRWRWNP